MEEATFQYPSQQQKSSKTKIAIIVGVIVLVVALIGIFITQLPKKTDEKKDVVVEKEEPSPSPTEKPKIEKSSVKIQVINGTGTPGQAGVVVKALEDAGYSSDNIKSSNAEKYDNVTTTITARADFKEIANDIKTVLKPTFDEITVDSSDLDENSEFDVTVVTGGKIFETETPTPSVTDSGSPTPSPTTTITTTPTPSPTTEPTLTP